MNPLEIILLERLTPPYFMCFVWLFSDCVSNRLFATVDDLLLMVIPPAAIRWDDTPARLIMLLALA